MSCTHSCACCRFCAVQVGLFTHLFGHVPSTPYAGLERGRNMLQRFGFLRRSADPQHVGIMHQLVQKAVRQYIIFATDPNTNPYPNPNLSANPTKPNPIPNPDPNLNLNPNLILASTCGVSRVWVPRLVEAVEAVLFTAFNYDTADIDANQGRKQWLRMLSPSIERWCAHWTHEWCQCAALTQ